MTEAVTRVTRTVMLSGECHFCVKSIHVLKTKRGCKRYSGLNISPFRSVRCVLTAAESLYRGSAQTITLCSFILSQLGQILAVSHGCLKNRGRSNTLKRKECIQSTGPERHRIKIPVSVTITWVKTWWDEVLFQVGEAEQMPVWSAQREYLIPAL